MAEWEFGRSFQNITAVRLGDIAAWKHW